jgi:hypothetical protein
MSGIDTCEVVIHFEPVFPKTCLKRHQPKTPKLNYNFPTHSLNSSLYFERLACGPADALLRENYNPAARAVRGGKTGPRGRERSEGINETTKHKGLRRQRAPRQPQAERRAQVITKGKAVLVVGENNGKRSNHPFKHRKAHFAVGLSYSNLLGLFYTFIEDSRRRILPAGIPNIILKRRQK